MNERISDLRARTSRLPKAQLGFFPTPLYLSLIHILTLPTTCQV